LPGDLDRIDAELMPPRCLIATIMEIAMMPSAEGHRPLVANLPAESLGLREPNMMGIRRLLAAQQAGL
jgi:hypothetical protein